jgi:SM-20-related protein
MTPKQILDSFSETLMQDERILSAQERGLVANLLHHAKLASAANPETREAVRGVIASAVGETVAQRAFSALGGSIVARILEDSAFAGGEWSARTPDLFVKDPESFARPTLADPQGPGTIPKAPGIPKAPAAIPKEPQPPGAIPKSPSAIPKEPQPPGSIPKAPAARNDPQGPGHAQSTRAVAQAGVALAERPERLAAQCVVLDEFLAPAELEALTHFTLSREREFEASEVVSPTEEGGIVNYEHRRSRVLMDLEEQQTVMLDRIKAALPQVLEQLHMENFPIAEVEAQITASNDGDYFHFHSDNASDPVGSRHLTFVYFFHREPRQFQGGELRIHDARRQADAYVSEGSYQTIVPQQNQIVFFPCQLMHEITPVSCPTGLFADSRFTLNGWLRH